MANGISTGNSVVGDDLIVCVIDDNEGNRTLMSGILDAAGLPNESYGNAEDFLEGFEPDRTGCLLVDLRMPGMNGIELIESLPGGAASVPSIMVTAHGDVDMAIKAMKTGAFDFQEKPLVAEKLLQSVNEALEKRRAGIAWAESVAAAQRLFDTLSAREREVYGHIVDGAMNKQIAQTLEISPRTVEVHRAKVMSKMHAESLAELIRVHMMLFPANNASDSHDTAS